MYKKLLGFLLAFCLGLISWEIIRQLKVGLLDNNKPSVLEASNETEVNPLKTANQLNQSIPTQNEINQNNSEDEDIWIPTAIDEECLSKVNVGEPFKVAKLFNPYYLRVNFDGNASIDYAVLVVGQTAKSEGRVNQMNGLIICKDSKTPFVFGSLAKSKKQVSSFEDDNFVTDDWEIVTKEETKKTWKNAKGESIAFVFEGGTIINVYWDGKAFRVVE
jgi:hypothetical protein